MKGPRKKKKKTWEKSSTVSGPGIDPRYILHLSSPFLPEVKPTNFWASTVRMVATARPARDAMVCTPKIPIRCGWWGSLTGGKDLVLLNYQVFNRGEAQTMQVSWGLVVEIYHYLQDFSTIAGFCLDFFPWTVLSYPVWGESNIRNLW